MSLTAVINGVGIAVPDMLHLIVLAGTVNGFDYIEKISPGVYAVRVKRA